MVILMMPMYAGSRMSPFAILRVLVGMFFFSFKSYKNTVKLLGLHYLPMSHKMDARLVWADF